MLSVSKYSTMWPVQYSRALISMSTTLNYLYLYRAHFCHGSFNGV